MALIAVGEGVADEARLAQPIRIDTAALFQRMMKAAATANKVVIEAIKRLRGAREAASRQLLNG